MAHRLHRSLPLLHVRGVLAAGSGGAVCHTTIYKLHAHTHDGCFEERSICKQTANWNQENCLKLFEQLENEIELFNKR